MIFGSAAAGVGLTGSAGEYTVGGVQRGSDAEPAGPRSVSALIAILAVLLACQGSGSRPAEDPEPPPRPPPAQPITTQEWTPSGSAPAAATATGATSDAPEISRSSGVEGGAVVLFPRIVLPRNAGKPDSETRALAGRAQARLAELARRALPGRAIDVRPEPERVCPMSGCKGLSLGVLFARAGGGCSVIALVSGPGPSAQRLVQWSPGSVRIGSPSVPFRKPPESVVKVDDYASCAKLPDDLGAKDAEIEAAIKAAAGA